MSTSSCRATMRTIEWVFRIAIGNDRIGIERARVHPQDRGDAMPPPTRWLMSGACDARGRQPRVTEERLPGTLAFTLSGLDVRHDDGQRLQRVGILPDVPEGPTIAGIRAGRDEVLERAVEYLSR
jgi:hypothetical protein